MVISNKKHILGGGGLKLRREIPNRPQMVVMFGEGEWFIDHKIRSFPAANIFFAGR